MQFVSSFHCKKLLSGAYRNHAMREDSLLYGGRIRTSLDTVDILNVGRFATVSRPFVTETSLLKRPICL